MSIIKIKRNFNINELETAMMDNLQEGELGYIGGQYNNLYIGTPDGQKLLNPTTEDTWQANTKDAEGYVAAGVGQAHKVWKTDQNGNPAWRDEFLLTLKNENNQLKLYKQISAAQETLLATADTSVFWINIIDIDMSQRIIEVDKAGDEILNAYQDGFMMGVKGTLSGCDFILPLIVNVPQDESDPDSMGMMLFGGLTLDPMTGTSMFALVALVHNTSFGMFEMVEMAFAEDLKSHIENEGNPHNVNKNQIGLGSVENKSSATIRSEITKENVTTALGYTPLESGTYAGSASAGGPANSVKANLKFGSKTYNGSQEQEITAADLNLTSPMVYRGSVATLPSTADAGDVYTKDSIEYVWSGTAWVELGDSSSFALKTVEVVAGEGLTGGGALTGNVTLSLENDYAGGTKVTFNGTDKGANVASFYAPENSGSAHQVLISSGDKKAPEWTAQSSLEAGTAETFAESAEIKLTGDVEGSVSSTHGWEIKTVANQAAKWTDAIGVKIQDADKTNTGEEVDMDGADDVTILLPSTIKASLTGNASTASAFHDKADITLKGDVTGTASSTHGWEITTELPNRLKKTQANNEKLNDANDALTSGFHYISGATTNRPAFKQASDHTGNDYRIWTTAHSDNWLQQIATDFRCNDLFYRRRDNGTWKPWVQIQTTESADGRYAQLAASNTFTNGHIYLGGVTTTSTENKTQLVFGTNTANHIALSSNDKCLILNPTTGSTANQICLYVNGTTQSVFPKGIAATSSGALPKLGSETRGATNHPVFLDAGEIKAVTLVDTANTMLNSLSAGSSIPEDNDYYISQYVNGGNTTTTYHRRPVSKLYDYMKNKLQGDNVVLEKPIKAYTTLAHNATISGDRTGYHLIEINSTDSWMLTFTVRLYQGYNYTDIVVSGYNYIGNTKTWYNPRATIIGTHDTQSLDVVFGNSADCRCWVAIPAGNYYGIDIINVTNGYTQIADWTDIFKLSYVASIPVSAKTAVTKTAYAPWYRDETIPVSHGGTGVTTLAEGEAVIGNGSGNVTTRAIVNLTSTGGAGWTGTSSTASNHYLINRNTLSYWDGSYDGTKSNLSKLGTINTGVWQGTVITPTYGGTGTSSQTAKRLVRINDGGTALISSGHYADDTKLAINSTSAPSYNLYVNGNGKVSTTFETGTTLTVGTNATVGGTLTAAGLISTLDNNFISHGNEFNFIPDEYATVIYINYQTLNRKSTGAISSYTFLTGNGTTTSYANIQVKDANLSGKLNTQGLITQGSPTSDTSINSMNRFQADLFVEGNGSAPNNPVKPGFYLGKSTSDANRHMDIVSGGDYSYIDFNKASVEQDYAFRILTNVTNGLTEMNWGSTSGLTNKKLQVNGALGVSSGLTVTGDASITNLLTVGSGSSNYGIKVGDNYINAISKHLIFQNTDQIRFGPNDWDYNKWAGLRYDSSNKYIYLGLADGTIFTANAAQSGGRILTPGISYFHVGNQTSYGLDSNGGGRLAYIGDGSGYLAYVGGGTSRNLGDNQTGYLTIALPATAWLQTTMLKFKVSIYNYSTNTSVDYHIGVYTYNSGDYLYNPTAFCLGKKGEKLSNLPVRFGYQGNRYYIYIGESNTNWNYPNVTISDVTLGHNASTDTYNKWKEGWSVSFGTSLASAIKHTISNTYIGYNAHNADYATNANYATSAGNADTVDGHHFHWSGQSGQPSWLWGGNDSTNMYVYNPSNFSVNYANYSGYGNTVLGSYTANGGQQNPNYFGTNRVGFLMMNTNVNGNTHYKDWIIMDCYAGNDVGGGVALGVNRQALGAYIMRSDAARTSWAQSAELLHTANYSSYALPLSGGTISGTLKVVGPVFAYRYNQNDTGKKNPSIIFDKPGGSYTGIGPNGTESEIQFGPVTTDGAFTWASTPTQKWRFKGSVIAESGFSGSLSGNASSATTANSLQITGYGDSNLTYYQTSAAHANSEASWASYIICNHGNGSNYYNQTIRMPFWGPPQYSRMEGGAQKTWWTFLSTENYSSYVLPLTGGTLSNNLYLSATNKGYYLKDSAGYQYPGVYDNGSNLWIGSTQTTAQHHRGGTYISAGHDGTTGKSTIYVSVPNAANNGGTNYAVFHKGYPPNALYWSNDTAQPGVIWIKDTNYFFRPTNDNTRTELVILGSPNHHWDRFYVAKHGLYTNLQSDTGITAVPNARIQTDSGTAGRLRLTSNSNSSKLIKDNIESLTSENIQAERLYNLPIYQFKYKKSWIQKEDCRYDVTLPGFIIEEMDEIYPVAVDKNSDSSETWGWNTQYLLPPMLKLIQDQKKQLDKQQAEIDELKELVNKLLEQLS